MRNRLLILSLASLVGPGADADTFTITNASDAGPGTLRQCITDANGMPGPHMILFSIPGSGPHTITLDSSLPALTEPATIDGYSQPNAIPNSATNGNNAVIQIRVDGANLYSDGVQLRAGNSVLRGLAFLRWQSYGKPVDIALGGSNQIAGCYFGIDVDGSDKHNWTCISVASDGNEIGGLTPANQNVCSYNWGPPVVLVGAGASNNVIHGNLMGTDFTGTLSKPNSDVAIYVNGGSHNRIGGTEPGARNILSGSYYGVSLTSASTGNTIQGNYIGTDISGTFPVKNILAGIYLNGSSSNMVGGTSAEARNVISGNGTSGILIANGGHDNRILGNWIGVGITGGVLSNGAPGISISGSGNQVGGVGIGEANSIAHQPGAEVTVLSGTGNSIRGNSLYATAPRYGQPGLAIDLGGAGTTINDLNDDDTGPNNYQNFPVISNAISGASSLSIAGFLDTKSNRTYQVDFYANPTCSVIGYGEGQYYLGSTNVATDSTGHADFSVTFPLMAPGTSVAATATDAEGNTSEFSACFGVLFDIPPETFFVLNVSNNGPGSLRQAILDANALLANGNNIIAFDIPGLGPHVIQLSDLLPSIARPLTIDGFTQSNSSPNALTKGSDAIWAVEVDGSRVTPSLTADGLRLSSPGCIVRGLRLFGFGRDAIRLEPGASGCLLAGNCLVSNGNAGLRLSGASGNQIGGANPADQNFISGNAEGGIWFEAGSDNNRVLGNIIGPDTTASQYFGSQRYGVYLSQSSANTIGDTNAGAGNIIAYNWDDAVHVNLGTNNRIRLNRLFKNGGYGIRLISSQWFWSGDVNDAGDSDEGGNNLQNFPAIANATATTGNTTIEGQLNSEANRTYTLDFYSTAEDCALTSPQGDLYLGSATVTTDGSGDGNFHVNIPATILQTNVVATATDANGNTSQFSECFAPVLSLPPVILVVTNTDDGGPGSLRQALIEVDTAPGSGTAQLHFNIPGSGPHIISPFTILPTPAKPVIVDGYTQTGASENTLSNGNNAVLMIQLDGAQTGGAGFSFNVDSNTVRGVSITGFDEGLHLASSYNSIQGCWIGVDPSGASAPNLLGVVVTGSGNQIGGTASGDRSVISGNTSDGVRVHDPASDTVIQGNFIGIDPAGVNVLPNGENGINIVDASKTQIGGTDPGSANVVAGNGWNGIAVAGFSATANHIERNLIGADMGQLLDLGNRLNGVSIGGGASLNVIGGSDSLAGNLIAFSGRNGVEVSSGDQNTILNNVYQANRGSGIRIQPGANDDLPLPVLTTAFEDPPGVTIAGTIVGPPNSTCEVQIYKETHSFDFPNVRIPIATVSVLTDGLGNGRLQYQHPSASNPTSLFYGTVTCANNTSEMSEGVFLTPAGTVDLAITSIVPEIIQEGTTMTISNFVFNAGPENATNPVVEVILPPGSTFLSATAGGGPCTYTDSIVTCQPGPMTNGQTKLITVDLVPNRPGETETTSRVKLPGQKDVLFLNNFQRALRYVLPTTPNADVAVSVSGDAEVYLGAEMRGTVTITNLGPDAATGVQVAIYLDGVEQTKRDIFFVRLSADSIGLGTPTQGTATRALASNKVQWEIGSVPAGGSALLPFTTFITSAKPEKSVRVKAVLDTVSKDPNPQNDLADHYYTIKATALFVEGNSAIVQQFDQITVSYPTGLNNAHLESTTDLTPPVIWQARPESVMESNGMNHVVISTTSAPAEFVRLSIDPPPSEDLPAVHVGQLDQTLDGVRHPFSDSGIVQLRFLGQPGVQYFNLNLDDNWVAQNVPILSQQGIGIPQMVSLQVPIAEYGTPKSEALMGSSLTAGTMASMPVATINAPVGSFPFLQSSGIAGGLLYWQPAEPMVGGLVVSNETALAVFPNEDQGINECAPYAILNSLRYLDQVFDLNMPSNELTIGSMKIATGWSPEGASIFWPEFKRSYMSSHGLPIVTEVTTQPGLAQAALQNHHDVEIWIEGHVAAVVGMAAHANGTWTLELQDDLVQGAVGGIRRYSVTFDPATDTITGSAGGTQFIEFVIERPGP